MESITPVVSVWFTSSLPSPCSLPCPALPCSPRAFWRPALKPFLPQYRPTRRCAASPTLQTDYIYFGAGGNFRLQWIKTGPTSPFEGLQKMEYTYDSVGNVLTIKDYKAGGTQTQTFTYDSLDRILTASASGGSGGTYSESYEYTGNPGKIGNLTKKGTNNYTYGTQSASCPDGALTKPHAVVTAGTNTYCYDRNGNMVKRNSGSFTLAYDPENRLTTVSGSASATFV